MPNMDPNNMAQMMQQFAQMQGGRGGLPTQA